MRVCAVVPAYNEAQRIAPVLDALTSSSSVERVVVVDDGSTDGTADMARAHPAAALGKLAVVQQPNGGKGAAMLHGA